MFDILRGTPPSHQTHMPWLRVVDVSSHIVLTIVDTTHLGQSAWGAQNWCGMGYNLGLLFQLVVNEKWSCPIHAMIEQHGSMVHFLLPSPSLPPTNNVCLANITQAIAASHVEGHWQPNLPHQKLSRHFWSLVPTSHMRRASAYSNSSTGCSPVPWISCTGSRCANLYSSSCCPESCVSTRVGAVCCSWIGMVPAPSGTYCCPPNTIPCSEPPEGYPCRDRTVLFGRPDLLQS
jgi:hypothetical protein